MFNLPVAMIILRVILSIFCLTAAAGLHGGQYRLVGWPETVNGLYCLSDGEAVPASIEFGKPSPYYTLAAGQDLTLYRKNDSLEPGAPPYLPVASLPADKLAPDSSLVIVTPKGGSAYYMKSISDSRVDFPVGSMIVCSFVPYKVGIKLEDEMFLLNPGEVVVPQRHGKGAHTNIQVAGFRDSDNRVKFTTNILLRPQYRYFMILQDTAVTPVPSMPDDNGLSAFVIPEYLFKPIPARAP